MKVLVVGGGGREHALAAALRGHEVIVAPGNDGMRAAGLECHPAAELDAWVALSASVDLVVVGPEQPLVDGLTDRIALTTGTPVLGPSQAAAALEGSKVFMKELAAEAGVETARFGTFSELASAEAFLQGFDDDARVVIKADGLCAGKGVSICESPAAAREELAGYLDGRFGDASKTVIIEAFLAGVELSVIALTDGERCLYFPPARDHKRLLDDDRGPNTGGMGAVCPLGEAEGVTQALLESVDREIFGRTLKTLRERGTPFRGLLYAGIMLTDTGPSLLEFNVRFGDPEAQAILYSLDADLAVPFLEVASGGTLTASPWSLLDACKPTACVVLASEGYPAAPINGRAIPPSTGEGIFYAGVKAARDGLVTGGGRVLAACASGETFAEAIKAAYARADALTFEGAQMRRDIGASVV